MEQRLEDVAAKLDVIANSEEQCRQDKERRLSTLEGRLHHK
jgi:hypothetical protein